MDTKNKQKGGYDVLMENIKVTPEMEQRITERLREEGRNRRRSARRMMYIGICAAAAVLCITLMPRLTQQTEQQEQQMTGVMAVAPQYFDTVEEGLAAISYAPVLPNGIDGGVEGCAVIDGNMLQVRYSCGITWRTAPGSEDISGDYNIYEDTQIVKAASGAEVTLKGGADGYTAAVWTDNGFSFALYSDEPLSADAVMEIINGASTAQK